MNTFDSDSNGMHGAIQIMALQTLHRAWLDSSARAADVGAPEARAGSRRQLFMTLFFLVCALPVVLLVLHAIAF